MKLHNPSYQLDQKITYLFAYKILSGQLLWRDLPCSICTAGSNSPWIFVIPAHIVNMLLSMLWRKVKKGKIKKIDSMLPWGCLAIDHRWCLITKSWHWWLITFWLHLWSTNEQNWGNIIYIYFLIRSKGKMLVMMMSFMHLSYNWS